MAAIRESVCDIYCLSYVLLDRVKKEEWKLLPPSSLHVGNASTSVKHRMSVQEKITTDTYVGGLTGQDLLQDDSTVEFNGNPKSKRSETHTKK